MATPENKPTFWDEFLRGGGGHIIKKDDEEFPNRPKLRFQGDAVEIADNPLTGETEVTVTQPDTVEVARDIGKVDPIDTINAVLGVNGIPIGQDEAEYGDAPPLGTGLVFRDNEYKKDKGVRPGEFDIRDYGALPSTTNEHDITDALLAAIAAAGSVVSTLNGRVGTVVIPPAPAGMHWYLAGKVTDMLGPMPHIEVARGVRITGISGTGHFRAGTRIKTGPLFAGFRPVSGQGSLDGGSGQGASFEHLAIFCTPLSETTIERGWRPDYPFYQKGDKIRPHRFHNVYFECLSGSEFETRFSSGPPPSIGACSKYAVDAEFPIGTATGETGNRWRPGKSYEVGDKIYFNVQTGHIWRCSVAGTTVGANFFNDEATSEIGPGPGQMPNGGEPDSYTNESDPEGSARATITEIGTGGLTWVLDDELDPEPLWDFEAGGVCLAGEWQAGHDYHYGAQVFGPAFDRIFVATIADVNVPQPSGPAMPAGFDTAKYPTEEGYSPGDDIVVEGGITWKCNYPSGIVFDNDIIWAARVAGAFLIHVPQVSIRHCYIQDAPGAGIAVLSVFNTAQFLPADFLDVQGSGTINGNGVGIWCRGGDTNACHFSDLLMLGAEQDYWGDPADHCIDDNSFLGNHYQNIVFQGCSGYALGTRGGAQTGTIRSCYFEGVGRKAPIGGNNQLMGMGTATAAYFRNATINVNSSLSQGGPSIFSDTCSNLRSSAHSQIDDRMKITNYALASRDIVNLMVAENYLAPGTADDQSGVGWVWNSSPGWWSLAKSNGFAPAFSVAGDSNTGMGPAHAWLHRGVQLGTIEQFFLFGSERDFGGALSRFSFREKCDLYYRSTKVDRGRYLQGVVLDNDKKVGVRWSGGQAYGVGQIVIPTDGNDTPNHRAFEVTTAGTSGGSLEPTWNDTLDGTTNDTGGSTVVYKTIEGSDIAWAGLIEDGKEGRTIQRRVRWKDSLDTDKRMLTPKTETWSERYQANTTATTADQIIALLPWIDIPAANKTHVFVIDVFLIGTRANPTEFGGQVFTQKLSATYRLAEDGTWELQATNSGTDDVDYSDAKGAFIPTAWGLLPDSDGIKVAVTPDNATSTDWNVVMQSAIGLSGTFPAAP